MVMFVSLQESAAAAVCRKSPDGASRLEKKIRPCYTGHMGKKKRKIDGKKKDLIILIIIGAVAATLLVILFAALYRRFAEIFGGGWLTVLMFFLSLAVIGFIVWFLNRRHAE